ncbi:MAG: hypothetical protein EXQ69_09275 [Acidimicrobiia bacterium]|nr:hypothetical protein [Acidimicrobiia bacterium]
MTEPTPPRDAQRSRVYRAEAPLPGRGLPTLVDCAAFAYHVVGSLWWSDRFPHCPLDGVPKLRPGHGARHAFYREDPEGPTITLPRRYRTTGVIIHELSHWVLRATHDLPNHGRTFTRVLLDATNEFGGAERAERLADGYAEHKVHVGRPARRSPDGRWHYAWDERLRRGRDRAFLIGHADQEGNEVFSTGILTSRAHGKVHLQVEGGAVAIPENAIWSVVPA